MLRGATDWAEATPRTFTSNGAGPALSRRALLLLSPAGGETSCPARPPVSG